MGFASYLYIDSKRSIVALANSSISPRCDALADYFNSLFTKLDIDNYEVEFKALSKQAKKKDLLEMEMVNSAYVDVDASKGIGRVIMRELFSSKQGGVGKFKITIEGNANMKEAFSNLLNRFTDAKGKYIEEGGVNSIGAKAKEDELKGQLMDYWLDNEGALHDNLNPRAKTKSLSVQIDEKVEENKKLTSLYDNFLVQNELKEKDISALKHFNKVESIILDLSSEIPTDTNTIKNKVGA